MSDHTPSQEQLQEIPYGYCRCGCGQKTWIPKANNKKYGWIKGEPVRYARGHQPHPPHNVSTVSAPLGQKACPKCGQLKPATNEYFSRDAKRPDGLQPYCKVCNRAYHQANRDRILDRGRAYWADNRDRMAEYRTSKREHIAEVGRAWRVKNAERRAEYRRRYNATNREQNTEQMRRWRANNKEHWQSYVRAYNRANTEKIRAKNNRRRAAIASSDIHHTGDDIQRQYAAQKGRCYYCKKKVGDKYHADHVIPLSRGGSDGPENIVIACVSCNTSKRDRLPSEWPKGGRLL